MRLDNYIKSCKKFAKDTKNWSSLDRCKFYTDDGQGEWLETSDNAHDGIHVDWAFHVDNKHIETYVAGKYIHYLKDSVQQGVDEKFDSEQWEEILKYFN